MELNSPKTRKGRERREQIIAAAIDAFAVQGSRNVSLASIAPTVGITEQGAMHYFPTKNHLLLAVLEYRDQRDTAFFERLAVERRLSLLDTLVEVMRHNITEPGLATLSTVLMAESVDPAHPGHGWFAARNRRVRDAIATGVAHSQQAGEIRSELDPGAVATQLMALFDGLALQWSLDPANVDMVAVFEQFVRSLAPAGMDQ